MMPRATFISLARVALVLAPLSLGLGACETLENLNPFDEQSKKTPLSGQRHAVFPEGVPVFACGFPGDFRGDRRGKRVPAGAVKGHNPLRRSRALPPVQRQRDRL